MDKKLAIVQQAMYSLVARRELLTVRVWCFVHFYKDGSLIEGCVGFAVHQMGVVEFGHKILSPTDVFTAELSALVAEAPLEGSIFDRPLSLRDFQSLARPALIRAWQAKWDFADTGKQGWIGSPNFGGIFFQGTPKKQKK
jgi:hypothetical protein